MSSCKVYVGNLAWGTDDPTLGAHFAPIGQVKDAVVMRSEGRSRGFGFVTFSSVQEAEHAIATMNDTELRRHTILQTLALTSAYSRNHGLPLSYIIPYSLRRHSHTLEKFSPNRPDQREQLQSGQPTDHPICPIDLRHSWELASWLHASQTLNTVISLGNGVYPPAHFGAMYAQPSFVGYPQDMPYVSKLLSELLSCGSLELTFSLNRSPTYPTEYRQSAPRRATE
ncbi:uncharacterized protein MELLADRAFT_62481 [Melampsora larici-populina 98AG31]|uniref:RRM domain-containing protein n=1 Tax=Melampsora larici-populina (strain 98AG31 / pathotype 3-4-7) TaxID=747676 RepID=F4RJ44_MELLP|nr:uncharacterized protein MELLADRAFT_62481 [Melampsora larici-populina 98AG31]EGG07717.1 hypothetical protein MELLADRAFT_62481 [Melampsora larici-populina 98AG31]